MWCGLLYYIGGFNFCVCRCHSYVLSGCSVRVRIDHSILVKFFISFKLSVQDKVDIGLMKIHFVCWLSSVYPRFLGKCC